MKSFTRRVERLKQSHRKTLLSCTALTALVFASPVLAAEYTVDSATIVENGAAENVLDGADTLSIVNGGSISPDAGEAVSSGNAGNTVLMSGNAVINSSDSFAILHAGADATTILSDTASILINGGKGVLNDGASSLFTMTGDSEIFMQSTFSSAAIWNSGARDAAKGTTHVLHMQDNSKITVYSESNAILLEGAGHSVILEDFAYVDKLTDVTEKKALMPLFLWVVIGIRLRSQTRLPFVMGAKRVRLPQYPLRVIATRFRSPTQPRLLMMGNYSLTS
ncbi:hypothetical protein N9P30_03145 [Alphaproteobacteria bacterium]|nr:hypothetical protein [Alphaproteobacteria bacterium]